MSTRRKKFTATMHFEPGGAATIQRIFCSVATQIQGAIPTETPCTIRITAIVTTDPTPAEIERHVSGPKQYQEDDPILNETSTPKFKVGQRVVFANSAREQVGLSKEINALVTKVHPLGNRPPIYTIEWPPTGYATVSERELREEVTKTASDTPPGEEQT